MKLLNFLQRFFSLVAGIYCPNIYEADFSQTLIKENEGFVPCLEMTSCMQVKLSDIKARRFHICDAMQPCSQCDEEEVEWERENR